MGLPYLNIPLNQLDPNNEEHRKEIERRQRCYDENPRCPEYKRLGINSYSKERLEILEAQRKFKEEFDELNEEHVEERDRQQEVYDINPKLGWYLYGITKHSKKDMDGYRRNFSKRRYENMSKEMRAVPYEQLKEKKLRENMEREMDLIRRKNNPDDRMSYPKEEDEFIKFVWGNEKEYRKHVTLMKRIERDYKQKFNVRVMQLRRQCFWAFAPSTVPLDASLNELTMDPEADNTGVPMDAYKQQYMKPGPYFTAYKAKVKGFRELVDQLENSVVKSLLKTGVFHIHPIFVFKWAAEWGLYRVGEVLWRRYTREDWYEEGCFAFTKEEFVEKAKKVELCCKWQEQIKRKKEDVRDYYTDSLVAVKMFKKFLLD